MKCVKCGAELRLDSIYCASCGEPAQIVPDYNLLDDEFLATLMDEKSKEEEARQIRLEQEARERRAAMKAAAEKKKARKRTMVAAIAVVIFLVIIGILLGIFYYIKRQHELTTSYDYYLEQARGYSAEEDYTTALEYYNLALAKDATDPDVYFEMVEIYLSEENTSAAIICYKRILELDSTNVTVYKALIDIYLEANDEDSLLALRNQAPNATILALFNGLLVEAPTFSVEGGTFNDDVYLELTVSDESLQIFYTTDGNDPRDETEYIRYKGGFTISKTKTIRAVAMDEDGNYSKIVEYTYTISYDTPSKATISPDGGTYTEPTTITIMAEDDCTIYYTWDGTTPTTDSAVYTEPIEVIEGNNILSVIVVNKHGNSSGVVQAKFKYTAPDDLLTDDEESAEGDESSEAAAATTEEQ